MSLLKSCLLCSLKTGCIFAVFYSFLLSALLLVFNIHDFVYAPEYIAWTRIISFIFSIVLFIAGLALLIGVLRQSVQLIGVWLIIFLFYIIYQIAFVSWNLYFFTAPNVIVPEDVARSMLINIIVFGVLIFVNILAFLGVYSYRDYLGGKGLIPVAPMA